MRKNRINSKIFNVIQKGIPVVERPFKKIGDNLGISEDEVIRRIKKMKADGYIRRIGGSFDLRKIGYTSALIGMKTPENKTDKTAKIICGLKEVTHCYGRTDEFNLWFTLNSSSGLKLNKLIDKIKRMTRTGNILDLRTLRFFKLKLDFKI